VFLDHNMPGMDGFQALEAIKANPATATIPVMMYTSQEGELYVGQARALGAIGVLPKSLHPVEVTKVLRSLHLIPGEEMRAAANDARQAPDVPRLRELIEELFYEQAAVLREEIRSEFRRAAAQQARAAAVPAATPAPPPPAAKTEAGRRWQLAAAIATAAAVALGALHLQSTSRLAEADRRAERLAADAAALASAVALAPAAAAAAEPPETLALLEWAANRGNDFAFGAVPLDDARAAELVELLGHLERAGFAGTVAIDVLA